MMNVDEKILTALYAAGTNSLTSKQLAAEVGVSSPALEERIAQLTELGYVIESHPHSGYCLREIPDKLMADDLRARLICGWHSAGSGISSAEQKGRIGNRVLVFEETGSTNDMVLQLAEKRHPPGLVVFAESQTMGRGRHGRKWISPARKGLWFTILLRPELAARSVQRLTVLAAVVVATCLRKITSLSLRIKWPNDILCNSRKIAGILVETSTHGERLKHAAVGIGINVNLEPADFPSRLAGMATSLKMEAGRGFHRPAMAAEILLEFNRCQHLLSDEGFPMLLSRWMELDDALGRQVCVSWHDGRRLRGLAMNLDADGALLVRMDEGRVERVTSGDLILEEEIS